jgi:hypothetical protein
MRNATNILSRYFTTNDANFPGLALAMANPHLHRTWEMAAAEDGSEQHCYGIGAGYMLSTFVLGVRRDSPV